MTTTAPWPYPRLIAHRGGGKAAPENTLAALAVGRRAGFLGVEVDAMLSRDRTPYLLHDPDLGRTTNGQGTLATTGDEEVARLDGGAWFSPQFAGEPVPTLVQALDRCRSLGLWINVEIKPAPGWEEETGEVVAATLGDWLARQPEGPVPPPLLSSFSPLALEAARRVTPACARAWLVGQVPEDWADRALALGVVALHCQGESLGSNQARAIKTAGLGLACYTVNGGEQARALLAQGVDALITDNLALGQELGLLPQAS